MAKEKHRIQKAMYMAINGSMLDEKPTGVGVYSLNLIENLGKTFGVQGNDTHLTVFSPAELPADSSFSVRKISMLLQSSKYGKLAAFMRFMWNTFVYPVSSAKYDILISPTTHGSLLARNQILTIHDLLSLRYKNISWHQRIYFKTILPFLVRRSRLVVTVSEASKKDIEYFLNCPPEKIRVIYNGYNNTLFREKTGSDNPVAARYGMKNYFLAIGPTYAHKNFETLLTAYAGLAPEMIQKHPLVIAGGKNPYLRKIQNLSAKMLPREAVHFLGYVPPGLMPALYQEAYALVFASLYEGFGLPVLEAMACGCPVISTNTSSMPEIGGDSLLYFNPCDPYALRNHMISLVLDPEGMRKLLVEKGLSRASKFSWEKTATNWKSVIESEFSTN